MVENDVENSIERVICFKYPRNLFLLIYFYHVKKAFSESVTRRSTLTISGVVYFPHGHYYIYPIYLEPGNY